MSSAYKFSNPDGVYFLSTATVQWVDVFIRPVYADRIIESLSHCRLQKRLVIHAWCLMSSHLHFIISRKGKLRMEEIICDFKKFTSDTLLKAIQDEPTESRKKWMLWIFKQAGKENPNNHNFQFWQQDNHPEELITNDFIDQKLNTCIKTPYYQGWLVSQNIIAIQARLCERKRVAGSHAH
ncbi:MAG: transposase [Chitinophagales bacterium]|nr:transposase [Chitinophagales bacterium]